MSNKNKKKKVVLSTFHNEGMIVDTVLNNNQTQFIIFDRESKTYSVEGNLEMGGIEYEPLLACSSYITSGCVLFPSHPKDYGTQEELLQSINDFIYKYVDIPKEYRLLGSYYVLLSYLYDNFSELPYLRTIASYGSGKSRLLRTIGSICFNPMFTNGGTSISAIFRMITSVKGTLILDESDFSNSGPQSQMIKILNNGYQKGSPILRANGNSMEPICYEVYGPKIIAGTMEFTDKATESRCLTQIMKRSKRKDIPIGLGEEFYTEALELRNKLLQYRFDNFYDTKLRNEFIDGVEPRLNQIINPLISLVDSDNIRNSIIGFMQQKQSDIVNERRRSLIGAVLFILKARFRNSTELYYKDILDDLEVVEGKVIPTARKLGSLLKKSGLQGYRKNSGTVLLLHQNKAELERLYKEYGIEDELGITGEDIF